MSTQSDLIDYFKLDAVYNPDTNSTREVTQTSNRTQFERQVTIVKEWRRATKRLGFGPFGIVWLEHNHEDGESRAVKEVPKGTPTTPLRLDYRRELLALGRLSKHLDFFVHFHGWFESDDSVFLAMEYFELGDLEKYITPKLPEKDVKMIGQQLFEGLKILHGYSWAHRDIKPSNIFVVRDAPRWWVKIGDFGMSKLAEQSGIHTQVGTLDYMAPELFWGNYDDMDDVMDEEETLPFTLAVDIWSLGCVLFRLLTGQLPFESPSRLRRYFRSKISFPIDALNQNEVSKDGIAFLSELMKARPADRMNVSAALLHSWTCVREPTLKGQIQDGQDSSNRIIEEISIADLQLKAHASNVGNDGDKRSHLNPGTATMPQTLEHRTLNSLVATLRPTDVETTEDELERELGLKELILEMQKRELGKDHSNTLQSMEILALEYEIDGQDGAAAQLGEEIIEMQKRLLGAEHPDTLASMHHLAVHYNSYGQYERAVQLGEPTVEMQKRVLGAEHPSTLDTMHNLALCYKSNGQYERAAQLGEQTVEVQKRVLGAEHRRTLDTMYNLAICYHSQGQDERAVQLVEQVFEIQKRVLGAEHPNTLLSMQHLTSHYYSHGQYERAVQLGEQTVEVRKRVLGPEHPDSLTSMQNLALYRRKHGQYERIMQFLRQGVAL